MDNTFKDAQKLPKRSSMHRMPTNSGQILCLGLRGKHDQLLRIGLRIQKGAKYQVRRRGKGP